jgi:hypothetical protein
MLLLPGQLNIARSIASGIAVELLRIIESGEGV